MNTQIEYRKPAYYARKPEFERVQMYNIFEILSIKEMNNDIRTLVLNSSTNTKTKILVGRKKPRNLHESVERNSSFEKE